MSVSQRAHPRVRFFEPSTAMRALTRFGNAVAMRPLLRSRRGSRMGDLGLLVVTGRRSGRRYEVPVGVHAIEEGAAILTSGAWRVNLRGGADVDLTWRGERRRWHATLVEDRDEVAHVYERLLADVGAEKAKRLGVRLEGAWPTHEELTAALDPRRTAIVLRPTAAST